MLTTAVKRQTPRVLKQLVSAVLATTTAWVSKRVLKVCTSWCSCLFHYSRSLRVCAPVRICLRTYMLCVRARGSVHCCCCCYVGVEGLLRFALEIM